MSIIIKTKEQIEGIRTSCRLLAEVHEELAAFIRPGISTKDIDTYGEQLIRERGGEPNFLNYAGYPASICVSVNDEVVHGIPREDRILEEGDIVSLDAGINYRGYHSDAARTYGVGRIAPELQQLIDVTKQSFFEGIRYAKEGHYLNEISNAIDAYIRPYGYGIVKDLTGHGVGLSLHEEPTIPNFRHLKKGPQLKAGMTLAIEPMVNLGTWKVWWLEDEWTVVSRDGSPSAHYENTVLITDGEPEILTLSER